MRVRGPGMLVTRLGLPDALRQTAISPSRRRSRRSVRAYTTTAITGPTNQSHHMAPLLSRATRRPRGVLGKPRRETTMKIFIDTGDIAEIKDAHSMGAIDGVTTNPSLLAKAGKPTREVIAEICEIVDGPVSAEVIAVTRDEILREGR